jgi:hypothetical protein
MGRTLNFNILMINKYFDKVHIAGNDIGGFAN